MQQKNHPEFLQSGFLFIRLSNADCASFAAYANLVVFTLTPGPMVEVSVMLLKY